jgi:hypothetical protein
MDIWAMVKTELRDFFYGSWALVVGMLVGVLASRWEPGALAVFTDTDLRRTVEFLIYLPVLWWAWNWAVFYVFKRLTGRDLKI